MNHQLRKVKKPFTAMVYPQGKVLGILGGSDAYSSVTRSDPEVADRGSEETDNKPPLKGHSGKVESTGSSRCFLLFGHTTITPWNL